MRKLRRTDCIYEICTSHLFLESFSEMKEKVVLPVKMFSKQQLGSLVIFIAVQYGT